MRLLFIGDAADSGFGTVTRELGRRFLERGVDVRFMLMNAGGYPARGIPNDRVWRRDYYTPPELAKMAADGFEHWKPDHVLMLADVAAAREMVNPAQEVWAKTQTWHYVPVEGIELPNLWKKLWDIVHPVAITAFGAAEVAKVTGRDVPFVWHGVDRDTFYQASRERPIEGWDAVQDRPLFIRSKADAKRHFGLDPDSIILLRTDRHMPRKNYNALMRTVAPVLEERDDTYLVMHCRTLDQGGNLRDTKSKLSEKAQSRIGFTEGHDTWRGMPPQLYNALLNAADVYVQNCAEGFGLNLLEAMACGVPVLGLDYSAVPEVVGDGGMLAKVGHLTDNIYDHYWAVPDEDDYRARLRELVDSAETRDELGKLALAQAAKFDWDESADKFLSIMVGEPVAV